MSAKHWRRTAWGLAAGMVATLGHRLGTSARPGAHVRDARDDGGPGRPFPRL